MVQANSNLTWRDMQHITVRTAKRANLEVSSGVLKETVSLDTFGF
jgi:hypothetical protein